MDYSNDLLSKIKDLSSLLTPTTEISALLDIDELEFRTDINTPEHPARKAFLKGYASTAMRLRKQNLDLVDAGSPAADEACRGFLKKMVRDVDI